MIRTFVRTQLAVLLWSLSTWAQSDSTKLNILPASRLWLEGTSTLHDYRSETSQLEGSVVADLSELDQRTDLGLSFKTVDLEIPVKTLHSGDRKLDANMYDAMNSDDHPVIRYRLLRTERLKDTSGALEKPFTYRTTGVLEVAGIEKEITMDVNVSADSLVRVTGHKELLMSDFGIDPPSMMLGLLKTDDRVVIGFDVQLRPQNSTKHTEGRNSP